jgi:predicted AAA+ superfamily ATPase
MSPVVVLLGARQTGKTTLVRHLPGAERRRYLSVDRLDVLGTAREEPAALLDRAGPWTLDEVQRAPELLGAIKEAVDADRAPGRFLLTGSAHLLLQRHVTESLAGRAVFVRLRTMSRRELAGGGRAGLWGELLETPPREWPALVEGSGSPGEPWTDALRRGGFPVPALAAGGAEERALWFRGYVTSYVERDLRDLSALDAFPDFHRCMRALALRTGHLVNFAEISRDLGIPLTTLRRYVALLEASDHFLLVPGFSRNRTTRLIKAPKVYPADPGLGFHLSGVATPSGPHLENLVLHDLLAWSSGRSSPPEIHHWRTVSGTEVDFVVEEGDRLLPLEVKATRRPRLDDAAGLGAFLGEFGDRAPGGLVLHGGTEVRWLRDRVLAVPWWRIL